MSSPTKVFFPGLNGLRFFAAFAVILTHVELTKKLLGHGERLWIDASVELKTNAWNAIMDGTIRWQSPFVAAAGPHGVVFFFVLSGFLITYLLLEEKKVTGTIGIKKFYTRRILRIWPLYYIIVLLGFFVLPHLPWFDIAKQEVPFLQHFGINLLCYALLFPNLATAIFNSAVPNIGQAWSIGVEEQFYLIWPVLVKFFKNTLLAIAVFFLCVVALKVVFLLFFNDIAYAKIVSRFLATSKIETMAIGGLGAYLLYFKKEMIQKWVFSRAAQWLAYTCVPLVVLFAPVAFINVVHLIYSVAFLIIILNVAANPHSLLKFRSTWLHYLGKVSYGIYMYHIICITFSIYALDAIFGFAQRLEWWQSALVYLLSVALTLIVSSLSYEFIEKRFINRKKKYTTVLSGDDAKA
ncbi:MAG: acyltransferase family protein [Flavobacteriales bacterium]